MRTLRRLARTPAPAAVAEWRWELLAAVGTLGGLVSMAFR